MKIVSVDVMQVPSGNAGASRGDWCPVIVRINTDEGISGFGEVGLAYGKGWRAGMGMVQDFAEVIMGEDPMQIERIWEMIFRTTFWGMGGGTVVSAAMSGIDIALWDIKGKALGLPVWQLMGGKTNDNLRTYASQLQFNWGSNLSKQRLIEPEEYAEVTRVAMAEGYDSIKVDPLIFSNQPDGKGPWKITGPLEHKVIKTVYDRIAAMRKAGGDDLDIIIENHSNTDTISAIQIGRALEDLRIFYYEEPCHPLNVESMVEIKNNFFFTDAATAEISRAQIWQWIHHPTGVLDDGRKVTVELYRQITGEELAKLRAQLGEAAFAAGNYERAAKILDEITTADAFETFLTLPAYRAID